MFQVNSQQAAPTQANLPPRPPKHALAVVELVQSCFKSVLVCTTIL